MATDKQQSLGSSLPGLDLDDGRVILGQKQHATTPTAPSQPEAIAQTREDTSITKVNSRYSPRGKHGQKYLAAGVKTSMRLWEDEAPGKPKAATQRDYETIGFVIKGRAELEIEGQRVMLEPGDSWIVPKGARHRYHIVEPFTAVEVTCPPAEIHGRDEEGTV
jgi:quercetin dioxygenase-like cupin family protein